MARLESGIVAYATPATTSSAPAAITRAAGIRLRPVFIVELLSQVFSPEARTGGATVKGGKSLRNRAVSLESTGTWPSLFRQFLAGAQLPLSRGW